MLVHLSKQEERGENYKSQLNAFFDVLEERFLDINPYCRCRVIQVYVKLCDLEQKFPKRRQTAAELAATSLEDKSSNVRRNAIKLLGKLVSTHPFTALHGGLLATSEWTARLEECEAQINALQPPEELREKPAPGDQTVDETLLQDATQAENVAPEEPKDPNELTDEEKLAIIKKAEAEKELAATAQMMEMLRKTRKYYLEALKFIEVVDEGAEIITHLLASKNKSEVIEAMDFFTVIDAYKINNARSGIRRMLRLIWTKGNSDEGKGVQTHLIECYKGLFFDAPPNYDANDSANYIARSHTIQVFREANTTQRGRPSPPA